MAVSAITGLITAGSGLIAAGSLQALTFLSLTGGQAFAAMFALGAGLGAITKALAPKPDLGNLMRGITATVREPAGSRKVIYGRTRVGGGVVFIHHSGSDNEFLHLVIVYATHEIESYDEIWFNDKKIWDGGSFEGDWGTYVTIDATKKGTATQTASTALVNDVNAWTSNHKLSGIAYLTFKLKWDRDKFPQGVPNITAVIKGKKVYDPRLDSTAGGSGSHRANDSSTWEYSSNPALCVRDYLTDSEYGLGEAASNIDIDALTDAADHCDGTGDYSTATQKRFECHGRIDTANQIKSNIEQLLSSMGGKVTYSGGKYFIDAAEYRAPTVTIDETHVISSIKTQTKQSRRSGYNGVKGTFISEEKNYKILDYPAQISSTYATEDGDPVYLDMPLPFVTNNLQAQRLAKIALLKSRQQTVISMTVNLAGLKIKVGDVINITNDKLNYSAKKFEVIGYQLAVKNDGVIGVQLECIETASAIYDWTSSDEEDFLSGGELDLYDGRTVDNVTSLSSTEIGLRGPDGGVISAIELTWTAPDDAFIDFYTVRYNKNGTTDYLERQTREPRVLLEGLDINSNYDFRVKAQNLIGVQSSGESLTNVVLSGDQTVPEKPTGGTATGGIQTITAEWSNPSDIDFKHVEVFVNTTNSIPASPTAIVDGEEYVVTGLSGAVDRYFWLKSVDFSGNKSDATASFLGTSVVAGNSDIGTGAVDTNEIENGAVTEVKIENGAVTADKITVNELSAISADVGSITAGTLQAGGSNAIPDANDSPSGSETGAFIDLDNGKFVFGDANKHLLYDGSTLVVKGELEADILDVIDANIRGQLTANAISAGVVTVESLSAGVFAEFDDRYGTSGGFYVTDTDEFFDGSGTKYVTVGTVAHSTNDIYFECRLNHSWSYNRNDTGDKLKANVSFEYSTDNSTWTAVPSSTTQVATATGVVAQYATLYSIAEDITYTMTGNLLTAGNYYFRVKIVAQNSTNAFQLAALGSGNGVPIAFEVQESSGLSAAGGNADTLDGFQGSQFLRSDADDTFDGDLTVTGQLILQGSIDQYNVTDLDVTDKTITVNSGNTQSLSDGAGLIVDRGTAADASITWNETADEFTVSHPMKIQKSTIGGELLHLRNSYDGGYRDDLIIENTNDRDAGITLKTTGGQYEMWIDSNGDDSLIFSAGDNTTNITMELYQNKNVDIGGDLNVTGEIDTSKGLTFNPNGFDINGDSDGNRTLFTFTRNGSASWQVWHNANQHLNFIPNNTSYKLQWNGNDLLYSGANISVGTISSGAITATSISATSLSLSGAFTPTSIAATSTVSGSQFRASYGSESAPAFTFKNDDDTGMYGSAARIHFAVSGDEKIQVQPSSIILYESTTIQNELKVGTVPQIVITSARALQNVTANASIITSGTISNARMPNYINSSDTRNTNTTPSGRDRGLYADFKTQSVIGLTAGGTYAGLLTFRSYGTSTDLSGGNPLQIAYGEDTTNDRPELYMRIGSSSSAWGDWQRIFADDYHPNADKWTTARTLTLTGDVTGSVSWDGSSNVTMTTTGGGGAVDSIANFANNRVITASDADSLNGEANLTFDGSKLLMLSSSAELGISRTAGRTRKIVLWDNNIGNDYQFYGFGVESSAFITSIYDDADTFYWYAGLNSTSRQLAMSLSGTGNLTATNNITANGSFITATASQAQGIYAGSTQVFQGSTRNLINIGTINSGAITSSGNITRTSATTGTAYIRIDNTSAGTNNYAALQLDTDQNHTYKPGLLLNSSTNTNYAGAHTLSLWQYHAYPLAFVTNNTVRLIISGSGGFDFRGSPLSSVGTFSSGTISSGKITATVSSSHTTGTISHTDAALDLYNSLQANTDEKGSILTFTDNYFDGTNYIKTTRAAIKGGTDTTGNTADGFLAFYTDSGGANSANERMRIDHDGKVSVTSGSVNIGADGTYGSNYGVLGFGGTSNGYNRIFARNGTADGLFLAAATGRKVFVRSNGAGSDHLALGQDDSYTTYSGVAFGSNLSNGYNRIFARPDQSDGLYIASATNRDIYFRTNGGGANTFRMTAGGNFQVGSTTVIDSSRNLTNILGLYGNGGTLNHYNTNHYFKSTTSNLQAHISDTGIGIGTSPSAALHVRAVTPEVSIQSNDGQSAKLTFGDATDRTRGGIEYLSTDDMKFTTNNQSQAMIIRYTGDIAMGTANPEANLHVFNKYDVTNDTNKAGIMLSRTGNTRKWLWSAGVSGVSNDYFAIRDVTAGAYRMIIDTSGNVSINSTSTNEKLYVNGNIRADGHYYVGGSTVIDSSRKLVNSTGATIAHSEHQGVKITGTDSNADSAFTSMIIDHNASGSTALTADRSHIALKVDMDSSATGGDTSNEHRLYGIHNSVKATGDSDLIYGIYSTAEAEQTAGQVSSLIGVYGQATTDAVSGTINNSYGVYGYNSLAASSGTTISNGYALYGKALVGAGQDSNVSSVHGLYAEVEIDASGAGTTISNIYGVRSEIDNDAGTADTTITNSFLFYGNYAGDLATSAYGVYIPDNVRNYFGGNITTGDGSTGTAAYGFNGDTNTGMYSPANHELGFLQNGTQRLKIDANGVTVPTNRITFHTSNVQAPTSTNATTGARLNLYPMGSGRDYTIGIESSHMWFNTDGGFKWYEDGAIRMHMETGGHLNLSTGSLKISSTTVIDGSRNITSRSIVAVGNGTTDSTTAFTAQNSSGTTIFRARDDGRVLIPSGYLYAQHAEGIYSTGSIKARGGITNDGGNNLSISSGGSAITFNSKNFTSVGTITSGAITSTGTITTTGGNIGLRRDTGSDGATLRDIEFLNSSAEGTDDRVAIIRANNQGGTSTTRGGKLTLFSRKANNAGFNSINLDQLGVLNTGQISASGSVTAGDASSALGFYVGTTQVITGTRNLVSIGTVGCGTITSTGSVSAATNIGVANTGSTSQYGISLYGGPSTNPTYGIMFTGTAGAGTHGAVTGDWATYFTMDQSANRGWIFRQKSTGVNVASISNTGTATFNGDINLGDGTANSRLFLQKADNNVADHIIFYNGTTRVGEIGVLDNSWLRINQTTNKNIYTPRYIRADNGFRTKNGGTTSAGYAFTNDVDSGLYLVTTAVVGMTIAGTQRQRWHTSGTNVTGDITASGNVTAYSDERLKSDIKTASSEAVYQMRGTAFIKDGKAGAGVIAQEIERVTPHLVHEQDDGYKSVDYMGITAYLIEAVKAQKETIELLTKRIEELENGDN